MLRIGYSAWTGFQFALSFGLQSFLKGLEYSYVITYHGMPYQSYHPLARNSFCEFSGSLEPLSPLPAIPGSAWQDVAWR